MPKVNELLGQVKGINQDAPRDSLPKGTVWKLHDTLPGSRGANLRARGAWGFRTSPFPGAVYPQSGIFANFDSGVSKLLFVGSDGHLYEVDPAGTSVTPAVDKGTVVTTLQNPVQHRFFVIVPDGTGLLPARQVSYTGGAYAFASLPASALTGRFATVFKDRTVLANAVGKEQQVAFSKPGAPTSAWDPISLYNTSLPITGIAAVRSSILCFHRGSMERLRGTTPADSTLTDPTGDMVLEPFPDRVGCANAKLIAGWRENIIFGDERGIYMTDGSVTTNLTVQAGISRSWKALWALGPTIASAVTFGDFYIVSMYLPVEPTSLLGGPSPYAVSNRPFTFVMDIPSRSGFTVGNFNASTYVVTQGVAGEQIFLGDHLNRRVVDLTACFNPIRGILRTDEDGNRINPTIETGWNRLGPSGQKRAVMLYPGYDLLTPTSFVTPPQMSVEMNTKLSSPESIIWRMLTKKAQASDGYKRARIPVRKLNEGFAFRFTILNDFADFNLFDVGFEGFSVEQMRVHQPA